MITKLFEGEAGTAVSNVVSLQNNGIGRDEALIQIDITGAASVVLRGKASQAGQWQTIKTITESVLQPVYRVPYFQMEITANTGSVSAYVAD